jgi:hypothetical protein
MGTHFRHLATGVAVGFLLAPAALACGDKLVALGGGVPFNRIHERQSGNVILYLNPRTRFNAANADIRLDAALTRAGHKVRTVATRADLEHALRDAEADLVLMDWADAVELDARLSDKVPTLAVLYGAQEASAQTETVDRCVFEADHRRSSRVVRAVDRIIDDHTNGRPVDCARIGGRGVT